MHQVLSKVGKCYLYVQPVAPADVTERDLQLLCDALAQSQDAKTKNAWQQWSKLFLDVAVAGDAVRQAVIRAMQTWTAPRGTAGR